MGPGRGLPRLAPLHGHRLDGGRERSGRHARRNPRLQDPHVQDGHVSPQARADLYGRDCSERDAGFREVGRKTANGGIHGLQPPMPGDGGWHARGLWDRRRAAEVHPIL